MTHLLSLSDINTTINHEPRLQDVLIGEKLGLAQPLNIRQVIEANKDELSSYGEVFTQHVKTGQKGGRPSVSYWLNEAQTLLICMFSKTEKAAEVRKAVIETFMAWRRGQLSGTEPATITKAQAGELYQLILERAGEDKASITYFRTRFNNHFRLASYKDLAAAKFEEALAYIPTMPDKEKKQLALPAPETPPIPSICRRILDTYYCQSFDLERDLKCLNAVDFQHDMAPFLVQGLVDRLLVAHQTLQAQIAEVAFKRS